MMKDYLDICPADSLKVHILLPASKSISNRALLINALSRSTETPQNVSDCDDTKVMLAALRDMPEVIDIGAAGTAMRFLTAYLCVTPGTHTITGTERMRQRPIAVLVNALRQLGAGVEYAGEEGFPPLRITGNEHLQGGELSLPGNVSSQYISALLMIAPVLADGLRLQLTGNIVSRPYLDMTVAMMQEFGAKVEWESDSVIRVFPVPYVSRSYVIENDWSAASYWYEMVALSRDLDAEVILSGLYRESMQGDSFVSKIYDSLGVETVYFREADGTETVRLTKKRVSVSCFCYDCSRQPDLAQTLAVTCAMLGLPFELSGLQTLRIKETDRIAALEAELEKLGVKTESTDSKLSWEGTTAPLLGTSSYPEIATYEDHRMAMSFAPACFRVGTLRVCHPDVVSKSYPSFWKDMEKTGFCLRS